MTTNNNSPAAIPAFHNNNSDDASSTVPADNSSVNNDVLVPLMGPILRRKKVVSMPLGAGGDFFVSNELPSHLQSWQSGGAMHHHHQQRIKQKSVGFGSINNNNNAATLPPSSNSHLTRQLTPTRSGNRVKQDSFIKSVLRRKQVSLDLLGPNDFFASTVEETEPLQQQAPPEPIKEEDEAGTHAIIEEDEQKVQPVDDNAEAKLFRPLRFSKPVVRGGRKADHGGDHGRVAVPPIVETTTTTDNSLDEETALAFDRYATANQKVKDQVVQLQAQLHKVTDLALKQELEMASQHILKTAKDSRNDEHALKKKMTLAKALQQQEHHDKLLIAGADTNNDAENQQVNGQDHGEFLEAHDGIVRATRADKIKALILALIMLALTITTASWTTHVDEDSYIHAPVGLACVTYCEGNLENRDFFHGLSHFEPDEVVDLVVHLDPHERGYESQANLLVEIVGAETLQVKHVTEIGPPSPDRRESFDKRIVVDFDNPEENHFIRVNSTDPDVELSFTLQANVLKPMAAYSEIVAALIMIVVYFFILIEVIHRTLVAIFGSMIAIMFLFTMHHGQTESIRQLMLHLEWSTLGLLFGMMLIVGELSHTGIFEWCAVRLLMASKGSFNRLLVLLCVLTAVASAFLDNVTTMLLVAPVTIDMCNILGVDPRPYLIGEVILSNIGGTATMIGDPPNIIIGSSFPEIGFVDFIIHVLPGIFLFCVPVSLVMVLYIYRYYLTSKEMKRLDTDMLKRTYPIYDEPRLLIAGTVTIFVILMFFLHPVHHKDTAWIALLGAFITIAFTNPHDVQDALRNHVEWDTLLFFAGLFVLVEVCAAMGLLEAIGDALSKYIESQPEDKQSAVAITLIVWVSAITSAFLDNIPYTATMIPVVEILANSLPTVDLKVLAWSLSFGACLGGNGTLLGASANIVTAGIATNKGFEISFINFLYPGMMVMLVTVAISNIYLLVRYAWVL